MSPLWLAAGLILIFTVLWDAFETVVLPRTATRRLRLAGIYFRATWLPWARAARGFRSDGRRERFLAIYGPVSVLGLLVVWAVALIVGFALLQSALGSRLVLDTGPAGFTVDLYLSGTTFFTLGLGDVRPIGAVARLLTVIESGMGFAFLAIVIAYFPVIYQCFSRREVRITLLDAWAGSPPTAGEVLRRLADARELDALRAFLKDWEYWCSELLESHISYPMIAFFRSQHQRQSWVSALAAVLDLSALVLVGIDEVPTWQAHVTFAIARHAVVDLTQVLRAPRRTGDVDRLPAADLEHLRRELEESGLRPARSAAADVGLAELRRSYEPYVLGLGELLMMPVPPWWQRSPRRDNWQTSTNRGAAPDL